MTVNDTMGLESGSITCSGDKHNQIYIVKDNEPIQTTIKINCKEKKNAKLSKKQYENSSQKSDSPIVELWSICGT